MCNILNVLQGGPKNYANTAQRIFKYSDTRYTSLTVDKLLKYTVSQKVPTLKLSLSLSNLCRFSKLWHCWKSREICYKTHNDIARLTLGMLLQYLGKLKIQISAHIQPIWKKMQTNCI